MSLALETIRRHGMIDEYTPHVDTSTRVPASTRIIAEICKMEKLNKEEGDRWMGLLFEFREWVIREERKRVEREKA